MNLLKETLTTHRETLIKQAEEFLTKYREVIGMLSYNAALLELMDKEEADAPDQPTTDI